MMMKQNRQKKLRIKLNIRLGNLISGNYKSIFKGEGLDFYSFKKYDFGDDVKKINWPVSERYGEIFVKEFREERGLQVYFVFDISSSQFSDYKGEKFELCREIFDYLSMEVIKNNDLMGCFFISEGKEHKIDLGKGENHLSRINNFLDNLKKSDESTNLAISLKSIFNRLNKKSIFFIFSDLLCKTNFIDQLKKSKSRHEVILIRVSDKYEKELLDIGVIQVEDAETKEQKFIDTSNELFRNEYSREFKENTMKIKTDLMKSNIGFIDLVVGEDPYYKIRDFFERRKMRMVG